MSKAQERIVELMEEVSAEVVEKICERLASFDGLSTSDATRLANLSRTKDIREIQAIIAEKTQLSIEQVRKVVEEAAKNNNALAARYYRAAGVSTTVDAAALSLITDSAIKTMQKGILNLSKTTAFTIDGKDLPVKKAYTKAVNQGIYATQQGILDYQTATRSIVKKLADSGLRTVDYESGYTRRLDSAARMNVLDGVRQLNMEYRERQGKTFGADGVEVSHHEAPATDHQKIDGRQFSNEEFKRVNEALERHVGTCNCMHTTFPIILGISKPRYTDEQLKEAQERANRKIPYTDKAGKKRYVNAYEATQLQRRQETRIRELKDERNAYKAKGDKEAEQMTRRKIKKEIAYYENLSAELGLKPKMNRTTVK